MYDVARLDGGAGSVTHTEVVTEMIQIDWELLFRYCGGECTAEERVRFERWLAGDPRHRAFFDAVVQGAVRSVDPIMDAGDVERVPALHVPRHRSWRPATVLGPASRGQPFRAAVLVAAAAVVALSGIWLVARGNQPPERPTVRTLATRPGERAELRFADGSRIVLAPASRIRYVVSRESRVREVTLQGEALFDVVHDARQPLVLRAGRLIVRDLGTTFDIRAYPEDREARVIVADGRVVVRVPGASADGRALAVGAGELARVDRRGTIAVVRVEASGYTAWAAGRLAFDAAPLADVAAQLQRWYGIPIEITDAVLERRDFTGSFEDGERLGDVLAVLSAAVGARIDRHGDTVRLRARTAAR